MYPNYDDPKFLEKFDKKLEFATYLKPTIPDVSIGKIDAILRKKQVLLPLAHQSMVSNFINPNTPYNSLFLNWEPGSGKTIGAISTSLKFINIMRDKPNCWVFIIGFSEKVFKDELLKYPQLGFITEKEVRLIKHIKGLYRQTKQTEYKNRLDDLYGKIKRRFGNRVGNGFFKFYGYRELVNRLFPNRNDTLTLPKYDPEELASVIDRGDLKIDRDFLDQFAGSFVICDEFHNTYNSVTNNNWGASLRYIFQKKKPHVLLLSATPLQNSPTEIIDVIHLLIPDNPIRKEDLFTQDGKFLNGSLDKIRKLLQGRISFVRSVESGQFPEKEILGVSIKGIDYLKFIRCPMSKLHYETYQEAYREHPDMPELRVLNDIVFPNPEGKTCIYDNISEVISRAPQKWKTEMGIDYDHSTETINGSFLQLPSLAKYSSKYSRMVEDMIQVIRDGDGKMFIYHNNVKQSGVILIGEILRANGMISMTDTSDSSTLCNICGKKKSQHKSVSGGAQSFSNGKNILILLGDSSLVLRKHKDKYKIVSHSDIVSSQRFSDIINVVKESIPSGTLVIDARDENLTRMGFVDIPCLKKKRCEMKFKGIQQDKVHHAKIGGDGEHPFVPVKFALIHYGVPVNIRNQIMDAYNNEENIFGSQLMIMVGSQLIQEAYNFMGVRHMFVTSRTNNIHLMRQLFGRAIRKNSHISLPPQRRKVSIRIYVSSVPSSSGELSVEEERYAEKIETYKKIQEEERVLHEIALEPMSVPTGNELDILPFKGRTQRYSFDSRTFNAIYAETEFNELIWIIKRAFIEVSPVWTEETLWEFIKAPSFRIEMDTSLLQRDIFHEVLRYLAYDPSQNTSPIHQESSFEKILLSPLDRFITLPNDKELRCFVKSGDMYVIVPLRNGEPVLDIDMPYRSSLQKKYERIDVQWYLKNVRPHHDFEYKYTRFISKWRDVSLAHMDPVACEFDMLFHTTLLEKCVESCCDALIGHKNVDDVEFKVKMIFYYDAHGLVIWDDCATSKIRELYSKHVVEGKRENHIITYAKKTLTSSQKWLPSVMRSQIDHDVNAMMTAISKKKKPPSNLLPVGHFLSSVPRVFNYFLSSWSIDGEYQQVHHKRENPIIIGYDEKRSNSIYVQFKTREPLSVLTESGVGAKKESDARKIKKGIVCTSSEKVRLMKIAEKLGVLDKEDSVIDLCHRIRYKLIYNELNEREKGSGTRWFYFVFEKRPL